MSTVIEIQTIEGGRFQWAPIYVDSDPDRAIRWGSDLLMGATPKPLLRVTDGLHGPVTGAWQEEGYQETNHD